MHIALNRPHPRTVVGDENTRIRTVGLRVNELAELVHGGQHTGFRLYAVLMGQLRGNGRALDHIRVLPGAFERARKVDHWRSLSEHNPRAGENREKNTESNHSLF